ncbi:MAG: FAD-dependent oxidoreductase, partial [Desulfobacteraceae bacterium]
MPKHRYHADVIIAGAGLAGIVTALELLDRNRRVIVLERGRRQHLGGLCKEAFGGIMFVDTPQQRKLGIRDTPQLALSDWRRRACFRDSDNWPQAWARAYVEQSREMIYDWITQRSVKFMPLVNWPERGLIVPGNSVPRWHIVWGSGHAIIEALAHRLHSHPRRRRLEIHFDHRVERLVRTQGHITGCSGIHEPTGESFDACADGTVIASGGICGGDLSKVKANWYAPWGPAPSTLLNGSHQYADGLLHDAAAQSGANLTHMDRQWHYATGIRHPAPQMPGQGLSLIPPRSALWLDAGGRRFGPLPAMGYTDTRWVVERICTTPAQYSWLVMNWKIAIREMAVSGCDFMEAFRHKRKGLLLKNLVMGDKGLVRRLMDECEDVIGADSLEALAQKMEALSLEGVSFDGGRMLSDIRAYDACIDRGPAYFNDEQLRRLGDFRRYKGDRLRMCRFRKIDDPGARPLIAIRQFILSRKSLGGIQTDLQCRALDHDQRPIPGLYAVGEAAGFGGGGIHGRGSLEGTFLGSC